MYALKILPNFSITEFLAKVRFEVGWFRYECISNVPVWLKGPNADDIKKPTVCAIFQLYYYIGQIKYLK